MKEKTCCFTGHRNIPLDQYQQIADKTEKAIETLIKQGYTIFCAGGALGYDTIAEKIVLNLKKKYTNVQLILVLPCLSQAERWSDSDKKVYEDIKARADKVIYTSQTYTRYCMHVRNRYLVDGSSACICYLTQDKGGTVYTVKYAEKNNLKIINVANQE